eukprot:1015211-Rhodomonas_salina.2
MMLQACYAMSVSFGATSLLCDVRYRHSMWCYEPATRCPVPAAATGLLCDVRYRHSVCCCWRTVSGTDIAYHAAVLRACYAMSNMDIACVATSLLRDARC